MPDGQMNMGGRYFPLGGSYADFLKKFKSKRATARITQQAWNTLKQAQAKGMYPQDVDIMMGRIGATPGPLTERIREQQGMQNSILNWMGNLKGGMGR